MALSKEIQGLDARINDSDVSDEVKNDILEQIKSIKLRLAQHKKKEEKKEEKKEDQKYKINKKHEPVSYPQLLSLCMVMSSMVRCCSWLNPCWFSTVNSLTLSRPKNPNVIAALSIRRS